MLSCFKANAKATCFCILTSYRFMLKAWKITALLLNRSTVMFVFFKQHMYTFHIQQKRLVGQGLTERWMALTSLNPIWSSIKLLTLSHQGFNTMGKYYSLLLKVAIYLSNIAIVMILKFLLEQTV